jgi:hypothetical protein
MTAALGINDRVNEILGITIKKNVNGQLTQHGSVAYKLIGLYS